MQILARVGESDIDQIKQGQPVRFTVQALPSRTFTGTVQQVRLQSTTVDNVVNHTVVVTVENPDGKLLPGMTARVDFLLKTAVNVLKVTNAALRYKPSDAVLTQFGPATTPKDATTTAGSNREATNGSASAGTRARREQGSGSGNGNGSGTLYFLGPGGKLQVARVYTGISDGASTEVQGQNVTEGMKVIDGIASTTTSAVQKPAANPLSGAQQGGGRRGGGGF